MSKPLPSQTLFAPLSPPWNLTQLDTDISNAYAALNDIGTYSNTLQDTGAVNAMVATPTAGLTFALVTGITFTLIVANTTTSATPTLNVNGTGALTVTDNNGQPLLAGAMKINGRYLMIYDGTNYRVLNPFVPSAFSVVKPATTARANTTTASNDPDLQIALPAAGTYVLEGYAFSWGTATTGQGIQGNVNYSGTFTAASSPWLSNNAAISTSQTTGLLGFANLLSTAAPGGSQFNLGGALVATASGTLGFSWAQNSSNANATNVNASSWWRVTRVL